MKIFLTACLTFIFISCQNKNEKPILPPEKMEAVLFEFVMAEAYTTTKINFDSIVLARKENVTLQKKIFAIHGITREDFRQSFDYYTKHPPELTTILDSIIAKENRRLTAPINSKYE